MVDGWDRHGRILQGLEHPIFPFHGVRRGHFDKRWLLPQYDMMPRGLQREEKRRVALAAFQLGGFDLEEGRQGGGGRRQEVWGEDLWQVPLQRGHLRRIHVRACPVVVGGVGLCDVCAFVLCVRWRHLMEASAG